MECADAVPDGLGRDAYRVVQESLTNVAKHAAGAVTQGRVTGAGRGAPVRVRNSIGSRAGRFGPGRDPAPGCSGCRSGWSSPVAASCTGGPSGDFVVPADLPW